MPPAVHPPPLSPTIKQSSTPSAAEIDRFIRPEVALLTHPDPKVQSEARRNLETGAGLPGNAPVDLNFQDAYAKSLNAALLPLFKSQDLRVRLNAAIVLQKVAGQMDNARLAPCATAAVTDKAQPVVLWGTKAARTIVPRQLDVIGPARDTALVEGLIKAVDRYPTSGGIVEEVFDDLAGTTMTAKGASPERHKALLPYLIRLENLRADQYQAVPNPVNEEDLPGAPTADVPVFLFFSSPVWPSPARRKSSRWGGPWSTC